MPGRYLLLLLIVTMMYSCKVTHLTEKRVTRDIDPIIRGSAVFNGGFTGFYLADIENGEVLYQHLADKYFTPASNTKILTLYTAFSIMGKSIPLYWFASKGDSIYLKGAGGPSLFHPEFEEETAAIAWLKSALPGKEVLMYRKHFLDKRFGPGWSWADYPYYYQSERSDLPLFGNAIRLTLMPEDSIPVIYPEYFADHISFTVDTLRTSPLYAEREEHNNVFHIRYQPGTIDTIKRSVPFRMDTSTFSSLFHWKTGAYVKYTDSIPADLEWDVVYSSSPDSIYRKFMQESDNFLAEQLLLAASSTLFDTLSASKVIQYMKDSVWLDLPHPLNWVDGSGLSRYNLFTPMTVGHILKKLYDDFGGSSVFYYFPTGGISGTIKNYYAGDTEPFIYAKTGTLANQHCLSGYILTDQGRTLVFSFMHNNFPGSSLPYRREMDRVLRYIKSRY